MKLKLKKELFIKYNGLSRILIELGLLNKKNESSSNNSNIYF